MNFIDKSGGIERIITQKANYLALYHDIYILTTSQNKKDYFYNLENKVKHIDFSDYGQNQSLWLSRRKFFSIMDDIEPDIVIAVTAKESLLLALWGGTFIKIKELHFARGYRHKQNDKLNFLKKTLFDILDFVEYSVFKSYDCVVSLTNQDIKKWHLDNAVVIENFVSFTSEQKSLVDKKTVLAVGRLDQQKGFDRLLRIWKDIVHIKPDWRLMIAGDGHLRENLQKYSQELGIDKSVHFLGNVKDIKHYYLESSIFVMTSRHEGLPLSMIEAMETGLCVVSFDIDCGPSEIIDDTIDGLLVEENNEKLFAKSLLKCINDSELRKRLAQNAVQKAKKYHIDAVMQKWLLLFESLKNA